MLHSHFKLAKDPTNELNKSDMATIIIIRKGEKMCQS